MYIYRYNFIPLYRYQCRCCSYQHSMWEKVEAHFWLSHLKLKSIEEKLTSLLKSGKLSPNHVVSAIDSGFECDICSDYKSPKKSNVYRHVVCTHSYTKTFECPTCGATFALAHHLKRHKRICPEVVPLFYCSKCSREYRREHNVVQHEKFCLSGWK